MRIPSLVVAVVVLSSLLKPSDAEACSGPTCQSFLRPTLTDGGLPANAPAIPVDGARNAYVQGFMAFGPPFGGPPPDPVLHLPDGGSIGLARDGGAWLLPFELEPSATYHLEFDAGRCTRTLTEDGGAPSFFSFKTRPAAPFPTSAGLLTVKEVRFDESLALNASGCSSDGERAVVAELSFSPSSELSAFASVTSWTLVVSGVGWASAGPGDVSEGGVVARESIIIDEVDPRRIDSVYRLCGNGEPDWAPPVGTNNPGLPDGTLTAVLRAEIAGGPTVESSAATFELSCPRLVAEDPGCGCTGTPGAPVLLLALVALIRRRPSAC